MFMTIDRTVHWLLDLVGEKMPRGDKFNRIIASGEGK